MQLIFSFTVLYLQLVIVIAIANRFRALTIFFLGEEKGIDSAVIYVCLVLPGLPIFCHSEEKMLLAALNPAFPV